MEYFLIFVLQLFGIGFHIVQTVRKLDSEHPDKKISEIFTLFFNNEWVTLFGSSLVVFLHLTTHYIVDTYAPELRETKINIFVAQVPYIIGSFVMAFCLGYFGQRIIYKFFGKAETYLGNKVDKLDDK